MTSIVLLALVVDPGSARATGRGLIVSGETIDLRALEPILAFPDGVTVNAQRLARATPRMGYAPDDLFVHDLANGTTRLAEADLAGLAIVSPVETGFARIGELFDAPGVAVLFESSLDGPADPMTAETFAVHRPLRGTARYVTDLARGVPEPDGLLMLACGAALLATLRLRQDHGREPSAGSPHRMGRGPHVSFSGPPKHADS